MNTFDKCSAYSASKMLVILTCVMVLWFVDESNSLKLEQVVVLSRHNIRTPLISNLEEYSPNKWPQFDGPDGQLTRKGAIMESYMAGYITEWLEAEEFIEGCPKQEDVNIYSNTRPRTIDTAKSFAKAAFPSCNITIQHNKNIDVFDPIFHPIIRNKSEIYKQELITEMDNVIKGTNLTESYLELNRILDIQNSDICKQKQLCDLSKAETEIVYQEGEEPNVKGPLFIGTNIVDVFIMSYYDGFPPENIAWNKITSEAQWELLTKIIKLNQKARFGTSASSDVGKLLLGYMFNIFRNGKPKFTVLFGHDSNVGVVVNALNFTEFLLKNQYEPFPIGGKVVFQKWKDGTRHFLKVEYVYPSFLQLRNAEKLSLAHPPEKVLLSLKDCEIDDRGLCPWEDFTKLYL